MVKIIIKNFIGTVLILLVASSAKAASLTIFSTDFNSGVPIEMLNGISTTESVQGFAGRGTGSNVFSGDFLRNQTGGGPTGTAGSPTILSLTNLPSHTSIDINFLLAIIDTWDGSSAAQGNGPDYFNVTVDGLAIFRETIDHETVLSGDYEAPTGVLFTSGTDLFIDDLAPQVDKGFNLGLDSAFNGIAHTESTLTIAWFADGPGWGGDININAPTGLPVGTTDETWAIDNVEVVLGGVSAVPVPAAAWLFGSGLIGLVGFARRKKA